MKNKVVISSEVQSKLDSYLKEFLFETRVKHAVLATKNGEIISHRGANFGKKLFSVTALLAGIFGTTQELASLIDEPEFNQFFLKGQDWKMYYQEVKAPLILVVLFKKDKLLGPLKIACSQLVNKVQGLLEKDEEKAQKELPGEEFGDEDAKNLLEDLFKQ